MTTYRFGDNKNGAIINDGMADAIKSILDNLESGVGRKVLDRVEVIVEEARPHVPVRTGKLKASLDSFVRTAPDEIRVGASMGGNTAKDYAYKVKFAKGADNGGKGVFQTLVKRPMLNAIDAVSKDIADVMVESVAKSKSGGGS